MSDTSFTTQNAPTPAGDSSQLFGVSIRAWLAVILTATVCLTTAASVVGVAIVAVKAGDTSKLTALTIGEPLYSMAVAALGFYFGQKAK